MSYGEAIDVWSLGVVYELRYEKVLSNFREDFDEQPNRLK